MRIRTMRSSCVLWLVTCCATSSALAQAQRGGGAEQPAVEGGNYDHGWSLGLNYEYTDNAERVDVDKTDESSGALFLRFDLGYTRRSFELTAASDMEYRSYFGGRFEDGLSGGFNGAMQFDIIDDYLNIHVDDHYGKTRQDRYQSESPNVRGYINELNGGLDLTVPIGQRFSLFGAAGFSSVTYGESDEDNERTAFSAGMRQAISQRVSIYVSAERNKVHMREDAPAPVAPQTSPSTDYEVEEELIGLDANMSRTRIGASGGRTRVKGVTTEQQSPDRTVWRLEIERRFGARVTTTISGGSEYSDTAQTFVREQEIVGVEAGGPNLLVTADPFVSDYVGLGLGYEGPRFGMEFSALSRRERHEFHPELDAEYYYADLGFTYVTSARTNLFLRGSYNRNKEEGAATSVNADRILNDYF
ncbi:MAG TPA: hypothetical protein VK629_06665, partial [Steroidobacteraceae bacterium]|nr:hypothetical protein [Steroidobacteraceae bacterium]